MPAISSVELLAQDVKKPKCPNGLSTLLKAQSQLSVILLLASNESESQDTRKLNNFYKELCNSAKLSDESWKNPALPFVHVFWSVFFAPLYISLKNTE